MTVCLMVGAAALHMAGAAFDLSWTHSVEKTVWRESWAVEGGALRLTEAAVKGSGAGMDPGEGARLVGDWWVWTPTLAPAPELILAASGATVSGWSLCPAGGACTTLGAGAGAPIHIAPCAAGAR